MKTGLWAVLAGVLVAGTSVALEPKKGAEPIELEEGKSSTEASAECGGCTEEMGEACKKTCEELNAHPGTVKECCGKFCASHKGKDGKAELACHMEKRCCAEHFAKTGQKTCPKCAYHGEKETPHKEAPHHKLPHKAGGHR